jgi:beta-1,2-xylosyltransferase
MSKDLDWRNAHRIRLHHFANNKSEESFTFLAPDIATPSHNLVGGNGQKPMNAAQERTEMKEETISTEQANRFFYDMALAGEPIQCLEEDGTCEALRLVIHLAMMRKLTSKDRDRMGTSPEG